MATTFEALERILAAGTWRDLDRFLAAPEDSETGRELRAWYTQRRAHWTRTHNWFWNAAGDVDPVACLRILALGLSSPKDAAKRIASTVFGHTGGTSDEGMVAAMSRRGPQWCADTVAQLSQMRLHPGAEQQNEWLARLTLALISHGDLEYLPTDELFGRSWARFYGGRGINEHTRTFMLSRGEDPGPEPEPGSRLLPALRDSPMIDLSFSLVLATPTAIGVMENASAPGGELAPAVAQLIAESVLDRESVLDGVLAALTRQDTPATQKGLAKLLTALQLGAADAAPRMPLLLGLLATTRSPVTAALLPSVLSAVDGAHLPELAATVFARPEKAQRTLLLGALTAPDAADRWGVDAVVASLTIAAEASDIPTVKRATAALAKLGRSVDVPVAEAPTELWGPPPPVPAPRPATVIPPTESEMTAALSRLSVSRSPADPGMFWDALVRRSFVAPAEVRRWAAYYATWDGGDTDHLATGAWAALHAAVTPISATDMQKLCAAAAAATTDSRYVYSQSVLRGGSLAGFLGQVFAAETSLRLGTIPFLLSTPSTDDGTVLFAELVQRLRESSGSSVGPFDLLLALLRLERVDPERVRELDGLTVPFWSVSVERRLWPRRRPGADAIDVVRGWIAGGGRPALPVEDSGSGIAVGAVTLPLDLSLFPGFPLALLTGYTPADGQLHDWNIDVEGEFGVVPGWTDHVAATLQLSFDQEGRFAPTWLPMMAGSPEPGIAIQHAVAVTLSHADADHRLAAVEAALTMMGRGRWSVDGYTACCLHLLGDGQLRLARLSHAWEQLILAGGLQPLWPSALAVLDAAARLDRMPPGFADLLAMLRRYIGAVPEPHLPDSLRRLALSKGASKARLEAAALIDAADRRAA